MCLNRKYGRVRSSPLKRNGMPSASFWQEPSMRVFLATLALTACCGTALALDDGDPVAGQAIAANDCATCHAIDQFSASPDPAAPPFRTFGAKWPSEELLQALVKRLSAEHTKMQEFSFEERQIGHLIAFVRAIQEPAP
jgi:mono/diheme cytochrome c family protein